MRTEAKSSRMELIANIAARMRDGVILLPVVSGRSVEK